MGLNESAPSVRRLVGIDGGEHNAAVNCPNTRALLVVTALGCILWIALRAIQMPIEAAKERQCFETMSKIQGAMLRYRSSHQGMFPATIDALQQSSPGLKLVCPSSQHHSATSTYVLPNILQQNLVNSSQSLGTVAVICNEHAGQPASVDQPTLIATWAGQRFRIPKSRVRELKSEPLFNPVKWRLFVER